MKNKIFFVLIIFVLSFASVFAIPQKQVEAVGFGLAIPGGVTLGAGTYALGALGLAGIVGLVGYSEHSEAINAHAKGVWEGGTQTAMDSLNVSLDMARGAGTGIVNMQAGFIDFMEKQLQGISANNYALMHGSYISDGIEIYKTEYEVGFTPSTTANRAKDLKVAVNGSMVAAVSIKLVNLDVNLSYYKIKADGTLETVSTWVALDKPTANRFYNALQLLKTPASVVGFISTYGHAGVALGTTGNPLDLSSYNQGVSQVTEAWRGMKDAGMVLPVDSAVPLSSVDGSPLTYNPTADNYTGIDGGVYEGTPAWAFPQPKIRVANPDIPNSVPTTGVYVDTPVLTGNPAYDDTIINNPAIPKTTTNVQTGVTVGNPDIAITEPVPPVDGGGGTPPEDGASCAKLKMPIFSPLKEQFSISFPFSIPWDIGRAINAAFSEIGDEKPEFKLDLKLMDKKHTINITLPKMFDDWKPFTDSLLLFIFDVLIMFGIYRFVKGAGS